MNVRFIYHIPFLTRLSAVIMLALLNITVFPQKAKLPAGSDNSRTFNSGTTIYKLQTTNYNKSASAKIIARNFKGAKDDYEKALAEFPNDSKTHLNYALLLLYYFDNIKLAKNHFEAAIAFNPEDANAHFLYSVFLRIFLNKKQDARAHYIAATKLKSSFISREADKLYSIKR